MPRRGAADGLVTRALRRDAVLALAVDQLVDAVGPHLVLAGAAAHHVALAVGDVDRVVARARGDVVLAGTAHHRVGAAARHDPVAPRPAASIEAPGSGRGDLVAARAADQR